jgi:hypothetical protein
VEPPSAEKYPRIGNRTISFEPPTIWEWRDGLIAIDVSLWGVGSLLTSMLEPTETLPVFPGLGGGWNPGADTVRNFCHQVGSLYAEDPALVPAEAGSAQPAVNAMLAIDAAVAKARSRVICPPLRTGFAVPHGMLAQAGNNGNRAQRLSSCRGLPWPGSQPARPTRWQTIAWPC